MIYKGGDSAYHPQLTYILKRQIQCPDIFLQANLKDDCEIIIQLSQAYTAIEQTKYQDEQQKNT
jgi:hypothetical protein